MNCKIANLGSFNNFKNVASSFMRMDSVCEDILMVLKDGASKIEERNCGSTCAGSFVTMRSAKQRSSCFM